MADGQQTVPATGQQQAPPTDDATNLLNLYKQITGAGTKTPGANVPYVAEPYAGARMPTQPPLIPQQDTDVQAQGQSLYDKKMAHQQSIGKMLGNAVSTVVNMKMQKDYRNNVGIIKDYSDARIKWDEANRVAQYYKSQNQAVPPEVQKVLTDNQSVMQNIEGDNKKWKVIQKSFPDYTDPTKNQTPQVIAGQAGRQQAIQANTQGYNNNNPQEAKVSNMSDRLQGIPPPTQQPTPGTMGGGGPTPQGLPPYQGPAVNVQGQAGQPQLLTRPPQGQGVGPVTANSGVTTRGGAPIPSTPVQPAQGGAGNVPFDPRRPPVSNAVQNATPAAAVEAGRQQATAQVTQGDWKPRINFPSQLQENPAFAAQQAYEQKMGELFVQHIIPRALQEEGSTQRRILQDNMELAKEQMRVIGELSREKMIDDRELKKQAMIDSRALAVNELKYGGIGLASKDPRYAGMASMAYLKEADTVDKQMKNKTAENTTLQAQIAKDQAELRGVKGVTGMPDIPAAKGDRATWLQQDIATKTQQIKMNTDTYGRLQTQYDNYVNSANKAYSDLTAPSEGARSVAGPGGSIQSPADVPQGVKDFAQAIAFAGEGYGQEGTAPTRAFNPGALKEGNLGGRGVTGLAGITKYGSADEGWMALYNKLNSIAQGKSKVYSPNMTINQFARAYVGSAYDNPTRNSQEQVNWANRVAGALGVGTDAKIGDIIGRKAQTQATVAGGKPSADKPVVTPSGPHEDSAGDESSYIEGGNYGGTPRGNIQLNTQ